MQIAGSVSVCPTPSSPLRGHFVATSSCPPSFWRGRDQGAAMPVIRARMPTPPTRRRTRRNVSALRWAWVGNQSDALLNRLRLPGTASVGMPRSDPFSNHGNHENPVNHGSNNGQQSRELLPDPEEPSLLNVDDTNRNRQDYSRSNTLTAHTIVSR